MTEAFAAALTDVAESVGGPHLSAVIARLRRPVCVAVLGRPGVGRGCVATALRRRGVFVASPAATAAHEVSVLVIAEALKDEELAVVRTARVPVLVVLTKADLSGAGEDGPIAVARRRATAIARRSGVPTVPMVGLLASLGDLEAELIEGLALLATHPPNLTGVDAFVGEPHPAPPQLRARLLARLDRFGVAHALVALAEGCEPSHLGTHLAGIGLLDEVASALHAVCAPIRYRRVHQAIDELRSLAVRLDDPRVAELAASDAAAMAAMTVAVDVLEAEGLCVDRADTATAHLHRAVRWRRYGGGPVNGLHRRCSADVVRGSLRLLAAVRGSTT